MGTYVAAIKQNEDGQRDQKKGVQGYEDELGERHFRTAVNVKRDAV
jgi:hypothetical protein